MKQTRTLDNLDEILLGKATKKMGVVAEPSLDDAIYISRKKARFILSGIGVPRSCQVSVLNAMEDMGMIAKVNKRQMKLL